VSSHNPGTITIPTVSYGGAQANQMLKEMFDLPGAAAGSHTLRMTNDE